MQFDGVELPKRTGLNPPRNVALPPRSNKSLPQNLPSQNPSPNNSSPPLPPCTTIHSHPRPGDRLPQWPQGLMKPINLPPKPTNNPKFQYQSAIETSIKPSDLVNCALDARITISTRELLATSPEVRKQVKELVSSRKVAANLVEENTLDSYLSSCFDQDPSSAFLKVEKYNDLSPSAAQSLPLQVIFPMFAPGVQPKCILDRGTQVVIMRRDIWEQLRTPLVANQAMRMESANVTTTLTMGLIENHPVTIGSVTVFLQIQVVEDTPFEVLLGRPFFDITNCTEISCSGGSHQILIKDPKTGIPYMFPTHPRHHKTPCAKEGAEVNFQE